MPTDLEEAIANGNRDQCAAILSAWSETERSAAAPAAIKSFQEAYQRFARDLTDKDGSHRKRHSRCVTAALAVLGAGSLTEIKAVRPWWDENAYGVLAARLPSWLPDWCDWTLLEGSMDWATVRRFVREGVCPRPESDRYYLWITERAMHKDVKAFLLDDPELLEYELWRLFEIEGDRELSLSNAEKYGRSKWSHALLELSAEGVISRERLLDATLDALSRDFQEYRAGWFSRFHEALQPTLAERAARVDRYLDLLSSKIPPTVSFALAAIALLDKARLVPPHAGLDAIGPVFYAKAKSTLARGLRLVERWANAAPQLTAQANEIVLPALEHESRDIREAVQKFTGAAPAQDKPRLISEPSMTPPAAPTGSNTPAFPRHPISPIMTVEELVAALASAIENEGPPDELERALDGVSRLCDQRPPDFLRLTGPLQKRARKFLGEDDGYFYLGSHARTLICEIARAWLDGEAPKPCTDKPPIGWEDFLAARAREIAQNVAQGQSQALLAAPTHRGGWISPSAFLQRLKDRTSAPGRLDLIQALLRLDRTERVEALAQAATLSGEIGEAVRHALGAQAVIVGDDAALWAAASRARDATQPDPIIAARYGHLGPDIAAPAHIKFYWRPETFSTSAGAFQHYHPMVRTTPAAPVKIDVDLPTLLVYKTGTGQPAMIRWAASAWPGYRESWCAAGCAALGGNLDWWEARWGNREFLAPLLDPETKIGEMALTLTALGLASKNADEGALATDIVIGAVSDDRIDAARMAQLLGLLFTWECVTMPRVTKRLDQVARVSERHSQILRAGLVAALETAPPESPASLGIVLELLLEVSIWLEVGAPDGKLSEFLAGLRGKNRASAIAKKLLALAPEE